MTKVLRFRARMPTPQADREDIHTYGRVGDLAVDLVRTPALMPGVIQVVVTGPPTIGFKSVLVMSDSEAGRGLADVVGRAVVQALEIAEAARAASPEAC